jgi:hypothetical protein
MMDIVKFIFIAVVTSIGYAMLAGWAFMIAVGVAHAEWVPMVPTIGYGWAVLIIWLLMIPVVIYTSVSND